jgi:acyl-CoA thioesterase I
MGHESIRLYSLEERPISPLHVIPSDVKKVMMTLRKSYTLNLRVSAVIICLVLGACTSEPQLPRLADDAVILAFGDSLTYGTGASSTKSYPAVLETLIGRHVINAGVPGEVTAEGVARLPELLEREKPTLLILCHGGNDLVQWFDQKQTKMNLEAMIKQAQDRHVSVILIAVPAPGIFLKPPAMYEDVAAEQGIPLEEEILETVLSDETLKSDYIHPNASGYRLLAEAIHKLLKKSGALN